MENKINTNKRPNHTNNVTGEPLSAPETNEIKDYSSQQLPVLTRKLANLVTLSTITASTVVLVSQPLRRITNSLVTGIPLYFGKMTPLAFVTSFYRGAKPAFTNSLTKGTIGVGARSKNAERSEETIPEELGKPQKTINPIFAALSETLIKIPDTRATLASFGIVPPRTCQNTLAVFRFGLTTSCAISYLNFYAALNLQQKITQQLPITNKKLNHLTAGALSGIAATFMAFPLSGFYDFRAAQLRINNGVLDVPRFSQTVAFFTKKLNANFSQTLRELYPNPWRQLGVRSLRTSVIFGTIAATIETVGHHPFDKGCMLVDTIHHRFFDRTAQKKKTPANYEEHSLKPHKKL